MRAWGSRGSQRVVPRPAVSASPENLLETSLSTKSETLGVESAICVIIHPPWDSDALLGFENHCSKPPYNPSFYFSAQCRTETGGCLSRLIPLSPSRRQALNICLHVLGRDGSKPLFFFVKGDSLFLYIVIHTLIFSCLFWALWKQYSLCPRTGALARNIKHTQDVRGEPQERGWIAWSQGFAFEKMNSADFPGGPVVNNSPCSAGNPAGFDPWPGSKDPTRYKSHAPQLRPNTAK